MRATERLRRFQRDDVRPTFGRALRDVAYALAYTVSMLLAVAMAVTLFHVDSTPDPAFGEMDVLTFVVFGFAQFAVIVVAFLLVASGASVALAVLTFVQGVVVLPFVFLPQVGALLYGLMCLAHVVVAIASGRRSSRARAMLDPSLPAPI
jgi:hypothetical protein